MHTFKEYIHREILYSNPKFSWLKVLGCIRKSREHNFIFWYRASYVLYRKKSKLAQKISKRINNHINNKYCCDFHRKSDIDLGLNIGHLSGIIITKKIRIGKNFTIRQNTTIGTLQRGVKGVGKYEIIIGDNVDLGANTCIIGSGLKIGNNVTVGAMSFINKDVKSNNVYITEKKSFMRPKIIIEVDKSIKKQHIKKENKQPRLEFKQH